MPPLLCKSLVTSFPPPLQQSKTLLLLISINHLTSRTVLRTNTPPPCMFLICSGTHRMAGFTRIRNYDYFPSTFPADFYRSRCHNYRLLLVMFFCAIFYGQLKTCVFSANELCTIIIYEIICNLKWRAVERMFF